MSETSTRSVPRARHMPAEDRGLGDEHVQAQAEWQYALRTCCMAQQAALRKFRVTTHEYGCLLEIQHSGRSGDFTVGALATRLQVRHNTAVGLVTRLCKRGYVIRTRSDHDRRRAELQLTREGVTLLERVMRAQWELLAEVDALLLQAINMPVPATF